MHARAAQPVDFEDATFGDDVAPYLGNFRAELEAAPSPLAIVDPEVTNARVLHERRMTLERELQEDSAGARLAHLVRIAAANGRDEGYRSGYVEGMHWGMLVGAIAGALIVVVAYEVCSNLWPVVSAWFR